jgi:DNA-directed RNA polymerase specialized sigma24 family protein
MIKTETAEKRRARLVPLDDQHLDKSDPGADTEFTALSNRTYEEMLRIIAEHLDKDHQLVMYLTAIEGLSSAEGARRLRISPSTYKSRLNSARAQLRSIMRRPR